MEEVGEGTEAVCCRVAKTGEQILGGCPAGRPGMGGHLGRPEHRPAGAARGEN